ncbi:MAG: type II toxin-antitoxin system RelE/ParE family toxin [Clostridiales bacterium]|nr:type II toxin-antitoxin system RelE/ParE family toxin [Clostridiales bacterium]
MTDGNKHKVIISKLATQMLVAHAAFLVHVNKKVAEGLVDSFENAANSLRSMPQSYPWLTGEYISHNKYRYLLFEKRYMLIFQLEEDRVFAEYVIDCRQEYGWLIRSIQLK